MLAINSISLGFAVAANVCLLLNLARRMPFTVAQPLAIGGWLLASFLLIAALATTATPSFLPTSSEYEYSEAFFFGTFAAVLYFVDSLSLTVTVFGAYRGHYKKELHLSISQRALMVQTLIFMVYILIGALVFSKIEAWKFLDSVYWADLTILTIGLGAYYTLKTNLGKALLLPFAIGGIILVGFVISSIRKLVLQSVRKKFRIYLIEKKRQRAIENLGTRRTSNLFRHFRIANFLKPECGKANELSHVNSDDIAHAPCDAPDQINSFHLARHLHHRSDLESRYISLVMSTFLTIFLWLIGVYFFALTESPQGWTYFNSVYFCYTTLLTISYGDFAPKSEAARALFVFWTLLAVPTLTIWISHAGNTVLKMFEDWVAWISSIADVDQERRLYHPRTIRQMSRTADRANVFSQITNISISQDRPERGSLNLETPKDRRLNHLDRCHSAPGLMKHGIQSHRFRNRRLAHAIFNVMRDVKTAPWKHYSFEEWRFYLGVLGYEIEKSAPQSLSVRDCDDKRNNGRPFQCNYCQQSDCCNIPTQLACSVSTNERHENISGTIGAQNGMRHEETWRRILGPESTINGN